MEIDRKKGMGTRERNRRKKRKKRNTQGLKERVRSTPLQICSSLKVQTIYIILVLKETFTPLVNKER